MGNKFGDLVIEKGFATPEQVEQAIQMQKKGRAKIGQILVHLDMMPSHEVDSILEFQQSEEGRGKMFGECAVKLGLIDEHQRQEAVRYQTQSKGVFGDTLIQLGYITPEQRDIIIREQATY